MARKTKTRRRSIGSTAAANAPESAPEITPEIAPDADKTPATLADAAELVTTLKKRELIDRVVTASGVKKKSAKPVVEAMLKELGDALSRGETLNLQPFGKAIVKSRKDLEKAEIVEIRLRRSKLALQAAEAGQLLAEDNAPKVNGDDDSPRAPLADAAE